jgi:transcriptional regulator with XRE-family HTH domain
MKENDSLAARFKEVREKSGLKQKEFATSIGISHSVISDIERGAREPSRQVLSALAELYRVDLNWLLIGTEKKNVSQNNSYQVDKLLEEINELKKTIVELENENKDLSKELIFRFKQLVKLSPELESFTK